MLCACIFKLRSLINASEWRQALHPIASNLFKPPQVLRTHFHDFMLDIHSKLRQFKGSEDPLLKVADYLANVRRGVRIGKPWQWDDDLQVNNVLQELCMCRGNAKVVDYPVNV